MAFGAPPYRSAGAEKWSPGPRQLVIFKKRGDGSYLDERGKMVFQGAYPPPHPPSPRGDFRALRPPHRLLLYPICARDIYILKWPLGRLACYPSLIFTELLGLFICKSILFSMGFYCRGCKSLFSGARPSAPSPTFTSDAFIRCARAGSVLYRGRNCEVWAETKKWESIKLKCHYWGLLRVMFFSLSPALCSLK